MMCSDSGGSGSGVSIALAKGWTRSGQRRSDTHRAEPQRAQKRRSARLSSPSIRAWKNGDRVLALDPQGAGLGAEIDGVAAPARGLAADRAVAAQIRHRRIGLDREAHGAAMAGSLDQHGSPLSGGSLDLLPARLVAERHGEGGPQAVGAEVERDAAGKLGLDQAPDQART